MKTKKEEEDEEEDQTAPSQTRPIIQCPGGPPPQDVILHHSNYVITTVALCSDLNANYLVIKNMLLLSCFYLESKQMKIKIYKENGKSLSLVTSFSLCRNNCTVHWCFFFSFLSIRANDDCNKKTEYNFSEKPYNSSHVVLLYRMKIVFAANISIFLFDKYNIHDFVQVYFFKRSCASFSWLLLWSCMQNSTFSETNLGFRRQRLTLKFNLNCYF